MSNRLLAILVLVVLFGGLYGAYYYFFVANVGSLSVVVTGADRVRVTIDSEFKKSYSSDCKKLCLFEKIPPVSYVLTAKKDGYIPVEKAFEVERGKTAKILVRMDREVKLKMTEIPESGSGIQKVDLDRIDLSGSIRSVKNIRDKETRLVTTDAGVFTYSDRDGKVEENPLYDDLLPLPSGKLVALVKKTSKSKLSLLNLESTGNDYILLVDIEKRERKVVLQTKTDGRNLEYADKKVLLVDTRGRVFEIENIE